MKNIGVFFGSITGNTREIAEAIRSEFGRNAIVQDINEVDRVDLDDYDLVILGTSTWDIGEVEEWKDFLAKLDNPERYDTKFALFGLGDQKEYPDKFLNTMGYLYDRLLARGATIIGKFSTEGFGFMASDAVSGGRFVGLALDQDNQPEQSPVRIRNWVAQIRNSLAE
ncbi:MAG: flavodoxin [Myxococcales bacterium]|nr:flavodoxin [Myxococcales bacterium]